METAARARGLAGWRRGCALGDSVSGRRIAAAKAPSGYARMTSRSGRVPRLWDRPLRMPAKMMRSGAQRAILIATQLLDIELTSSQQTRKHFLMCTFWGCLERRTSPISTHEPRQFYSIQIYRYEFTGSGKLLQRKEHRQDCLCYRTTDLFSGARSGGDFLPGALRLGRGVPGDAGLAFP